MQRKSINMVRKPQTTVYVFIYLKSNINYESLSQTIDLSQEHSVVQLTNEELQQITMMSFV